MMTQAPITQGMSLRSRGVTLNSLILVWLHKEPMRGKVPSCAVRFFAYFRRRWRETEVATTGLETVIADLKHNDVVHGLATNPN